MHIEDGCSQSMSSVVVNTQGRESGGSGRQAAGGSAS
jgi:hypothetical protein